MKSETVDDPIDTSKDPAFRAQNPRRRLLGGGYQASRHRRTARRNPGRRQRRLDVSRTVLRRFLRRSRERGSERLTGRELEILQLLAKGESTESITERLT